jgi:hypothetical protein
MRKRRSRPEIGRPDCRSHTPAFDWDRLPHHVATIWADLAAADTWTLREPHQPECVWGIVHDPFGKTLHGCDSPHRIGAIVQIGEATMAWHGSRVVPVFARILRKASHAEAERLAQKRLTKRTYCYEVSLD